MTLIERAVLRKIANGPVWKRSLQNAKPVLDQLMVRGLVQAVAPPNGRGRNMVALTAHGRAALVGADLR